MRFGAKHEKWLCVSFFHKDQVGQADDVVCRIFWRDAQNMRTLEDSIGDLSYEII